MFQYFFNTHAEVAQSVGKKKHGKIGQVPGHLPSNADVPLSKVPILQMLTYTIQ